MDIFFITYVPLNTVLHIFIYMFIYFENNCQLVRLFCRFIFVFLWFNIFYSDIFCLLILSTSVYNLLLNSFTAILVTIFKSFDYSISIIHYYFLLLICGDILYLVIHFLGDINHG